MVFVLHWLPVSHGNGPQILLLWWHTGVFHPVDMGVYQNWVCFQILCGSVIWGKYVSLIWSYIGQEVRKCSSVSTSFCGQCAHSLSFLESQVCLPRSLSTARLCSLSLSIVKDFLKFGSVTVVRYSSLLCWVDYFFVSQNILAFS